MSWRGDGFTPRLESVEKLELYISAHICLLPYMLNLVNERILLIHYWTWTLSWFQKAFSLTLCSSFANWFFFFSPKYWSSFCRFQMVGQIITKFIITLWFQESCNHNSSTLLPWVKNLHLNKFLTLNKRFLYSRCL